MISDSYSMKKADKTMITKEKSLVTEITSTERKWKSHPLKEILPKSLIKDIKSEKTLITLLMKLENLRKKS